MTCDRLKTKAAPQKLEEMIALQKAILKNLNEGFIAADPNGQLIDINPAGLRLLGFETVRDIAMYHERLFDMFDITYLNGDAVSPAGLPFSKILNEEEFTDYVLQMRRRESGALWIATFSGTPVYNDAGEFILAVLILRDITDQKRNEKELKQSHAKLERQAREQAIALSNERKRFYFVLENLPAYVCLHATDYTLPYTNRYFKRQFGNPRGKFCYTIKRERDHKCRQCRIYKVLSTNQPYEWDWYDAPDNRIYHVYDYPFIDVDGSKMVLEMGVDITRRVEAENKLKRYSNELELRNQELQSFAYVASHDLQEPLRKIQAFGNRLSRTYSDIFDEKGKDYLKRMDNAAERMRALITALLHYSRVSLKDITFTLVDTNHLINDVLADLEDTIQKRKARVTVAPLEPIEADPNQLGQLFQNLISNAVKFNTADHPEIRIHGQILDYGKPHAGACTSAVWYQIVIEDNGIGFEAQHTERIFTPFQRLHGTHKYEGTGIGLSICRKVVENHGGTITVKSTPNIGSAFIITLPLKTPLRVMNPI